MKYCILDLHYTAFNIIHFPESSEKVTKLLNSTGSFTIFAPTDDAFDQLPREAVNELFDDTKALENILKKHVVTSSLLSPSLTFVDLITAGKAKIKVSISYPT